MGSLQILCRGTAKDGLVTRIRQLRYGRGLRDNQHLIALAIRIYAIQGLYEHSHLIFWISDIFQKHNDFLESCKYT